MSESGDTSLNQDDYDALCDIYETNGSGSVEWSKAFVASVVTTEFVEGERRVTRLDHEKLPIAKLPKSIGSLLHLAYLNLGGSPIRSLPASIGTLHNLEELFLDRTPGLSRLPRAIGLLANLLRLILCESGIKALPASIGKLWNLVELDLYRTKRLSRLPEEIGNLLQLRYLHLGHSGVRSLPGSIGSLRNLEILTLHYTGVASLPEAVGALPRLERLSLHATDIAFLPGAAGTLPNLRDLSLAQTRIPRLPEWIGALNDLRVLCLSESNLSNLEGNEDKNEFLWWLAQRCRCLGTIENFGSEEFQLNAKVHLALARNRARIRFPFLTTGSDESWEHTCAARLWPLLLSSARNVFEGNEFWSDLPFPKKPDALYQLLTDGVESFLSVVNHRNARPELPASNGDLKTDAVVPLDGTVADADYIEHNGHRNAQPELPASNEDLKTDAVVPLDGTVADVDYIEHIGYVVHV